MNFGLGLKFPTTFEMALSISCHFCSEYFCEVEVVSLSTDNYKIELWNSKGLQNQVFYDLFFLQK